MFVFRKIWCALFCCYLRFKIRSFALSPTYYPVWNVLPTEIIDNRVINAQAAFACLNLAVKTPEKYV